MNKIIDVSKNLINKLFFFLVIGLASLILILDIIVDIDWMSSSSSAATIIGVIVSMLVEAILFGAMIVTLILKKEAAFKVIAVLFMSYEVIRFTYSLADPIFNFDVGTASQTVIGIFRLLFYLLVVSGLVLFILSLVSDKFVNFKALSYLCWLGAVAFGLACLIVEIICYAVDGYYYTSILNSLSIYLGSAPLAFILYSKLVSE